MGAEKYRTKLALAARRRKAGVASANEELVSNSDVPSIRDGAPSAQLTISSLLRVLRNEAEGKRPAPAWGTYEEYWARQMKSIATGESKEYYERVFRRFNSARHRLGLSPIVVPAYGTFHLP